MNIRNCLIYSVPIALFMVLSSLSSFAISFEPSIFPQRRSIGFNAKKLGRCLSIETRSIKSKILWNLRPYYWDPVLEIRAPLSGQNFFDYLIQKSARKFEYSGGNEVRIFKAILHSPERSLDFISLFKIALEESQHEAFMAVLSLHHIFRWMARPEADSKLPIWWREFSNLSEKTQTQFWARMIDFRGDLTERGSEFIGDFKGSWYRFWGMMSSSLWQILMKKSKSPFSPERAISNLLYLKLQALGAFAEWSKRICKDEWLYRLCILNDENWDLDLEGKSRVNSAAVAATFEWYEFSWSSHTKLNPSKLDPRAPSGYAKSCQVSDYLFYFSY